jgi:hypothetical protein
MQTKIKKYEIKDLGTVEVKTKAFDEKSGKIVDGTTKKRHAFLITNPNRSSCVVYQEDLKMLGISLESVDLINDEGDKVGSDTPLIPGTKRKYIRRK